MVDPVKTYVSTEQDKYRVGDADIIHHFDDASNHCIEVNGKRGAWASYTEFARYEDYYGTTEYWLGVLPPVFRIMRPINE